MNTISLGSVWPFRVSEVECDHYNELMGGAIVLFRETADHFFGGISWSPAENTYPCGNTDGYHYEYRERPLN